MSACDLCCHRCSHDELSGCCSCDALTCSDCTHESEGETQCAACHDEAMADAWAMYGGLTREQLLAVRPCGAGARA